MQLKVYLGESPEQQWRMEINVFGQILKFFVFTACRLSAWWKRSREMGCAPVPLSECLRSPRPHKCAPSATAASTAPSQSGSPRLMEKQIHTKEGLFTLCSLLLSPAESWGLAVETNLIISSAANAHNFIYIDFWFTAFSTSPFFVKNFDVSHMEGFPQRSLQGFWKILVENTLQLS